MGERAPATRSNKKWIEDVEWNENREAAVRAYIERRERGGGKMLEKAHPKKHLQVLLARAVDESVFESALQGDAHILCDG